VRIHGATSDKTTQHPQFLQAKALVDEAQRQLDDAAVRAPFAGIVTQVSAIARGKYLAASTTAFYLVATDHVWVDATPKETELTYVRSGQSVTVTVDTYPDAVWRGVVESVSPAAAQQFALLPAQNTSGNWVKVVQRIPLRVRVDTNEKNLSLLRAGMSVEVDVDTGHARGLPHFLAALLGRGSRDA
jgi:membrane fusion protein, multidrug efflux system